VEISDACGSGHCFLGDSIGVTVIRIISRGQTINSDL
jgi:hypothetical protein